MNITSFEKKSDNKYELSIEVDKDRVKKESEKSFRELAHYVQIPGFRKGKVPRHILLQRVGKENFFNEISKELVQEAFTDAVLEKKLKVIDQKIENIKVDFEQPLTFDVEVETIPVIDIKDYKNVEIESEKEELTEKDLENELFSLRKNHGTLKVVEDENRELKDKDLAIIDFEGKIDGVAFDGGKAENHSLEIGSKSFIDNFEEQLIGMKKGETKDIKVTFPKNYQKEEFASKEAVFTVKLNEIKEYELPELNDDFAKELNYENVEELKTKTKERLSKEKIDRIKNMKQNLVIDAIIKNNPDIDPPKQLIDQEINKQLDNFDRQLRQAGLSLEAYEKKVPGSIMRIRESYKEQAKQSAIVEMIIHSILNKENISLNEDEAIEKIEEYALMMNQDPEILKESYKNDPSTNYYIFDIFLREKTLKYLVDNAKISYK
jgi:trigger factor